jgi:hypothetical protein
MESLKDRDDFLPAAMQALEGQPNFEVVTTTVKKEKKQEDLYDPADII